MTFFILIVTVWSAIFLLSWALVHGAKISRMAADPSLQEFEDNEQAKALDEYIRKKERKS